MEREDYRDDGESTRAVRREWLVAGCLSLVTSVLLGFLLLLATRASRLEAAPVEYQSAALPGRGAGYIRSPRSRGAGGPEAHAVFVPGPSRPAVLPQAHGARGGGLLKLSSTSGWELAEFSTSRSREHGAGSVVLVVCAWLLSLTLIACPPRVRR